MFKSNRLFAIDVSGIPPKNDTYFSCVSFDLHKSDKFFNNFKKEFKPYFHKKGKHLDHDTLYDILEFLDKHQVISYSTIYTINNWAHALKMVPKIEL